MSDAHDPMKEITNLRDSLGKVIEEGLQKMSGSNSTVKLDVYEIGDEIVIRTSALDGLVAESIDVSMDGKVLTISGETRADNLPEGAEYLVQERRYGTFKRTVEIYVPVIASEAKAKLKNGSLTITLPVDTSSYHDIKVTPVE